MMIKEWGDEGSERQESPKGLGFPTPCKMYSNILLSAFLDHKNEIFVTSAAWKSSEGKLWQLPCRALILDSVNLSIRAVPS